MTCIKTILALTLGVSMLASVADAEMMSQYDAVVRTADGAVVGDSTLQRHDNRINVVLRTTDLDPGATMTGWWRIYNRPRHCAVAFACEASDLDNPDVDGSQLHATAFVVGDADGEATVIATLYRTAARAQGGGSFADSLAEGFLKGRGLRRPHNAEIELLLASHGRTADPAEVGEDAALEQLLTPGGTPLDCADMSASSPARSFRCGVIQKVSHAGM